MSLMFVILNRWPYIKHPLKHKREKESSALVSYRSALFIKLKDIIACGTTAASSYTERCARNNILAERTKTWL